MTQYGFDDIAPTHPKRLVNDLTQRLQPIKLVILDVDGTLTDGGMYFSADGDSLKRFYVHDGMGITLLQRAGIDIALMTSEDSPIVTARAKKLHIQHVFLFCRAKKAAVEKLAEATGLSLHELAYMGDDVNDAAPMRIVGVSACPRDAVAEIQSIAHYRCEHPGGQGAVREFAERILKAQGKPITLPDVW